MSHIVHGNQEVIEQPPREMWDPDVGGNVKRRTWKGLKAPIRVLRENLINTLDRKPVRVNIIELTGPHAQLEADYEITGADAAADQVEEVIDGAIHRWLVTGTPVEVPLRTHPNLDGIASAIADADKLIREGLHDEILSDESASANLKSYVEHMIRGADSYRTYHWTITHTITGARETDIRNSIDGIGTVIATDDLDVPNTLNIRVPDDHTWLKEAPETEYVPRGKVRITQRYIGAVKWSKLAYTGGEWNPGDHLSS